MSKEWLLEKIKLFRGTLKSCKSQISVSILDNHLLIHCLIFPVLHQSGVAKIRTTKSTQFLPKKFVNPEVNH